MYGKQTLVLVYASMQILRQKATSACLSFFEKAFFYFHTIVHYLVLVGIFFPKSTKSSYILFQLNILLYYLLIFLMVKGKITIAAQHDASYRSNRECHKPRFNPTHSESRHEK